MGCYLAAVISPFVIAIWDLDPRILAAKLLAGILLLILPLLGLGLLVSLLGMLGLYRR